MYHKYLLIIKTQRLEDKIYRHLPKNKEPEWKELMPKVKLSAMLSAMEAAILGRSCDQEGDTVTSHDQVTKEQ